MKLNSLFTVSIAVTSVNSESPSFLIFISLTPERLSLKVPEIVTKLFVQVEGEAESVEISGFVISALTAIVQSDTFPALSVKRTK